MARPAKNKETEEVKETVSKTETVAKTEEKTQSAKLKKIKVKETLRGSYGSFDIGQIVEVPELLATAFIKCNVAEEYTEKKE